MQSLVAPGVLGDSGATARDRRRRQAIAVTLRREVRLDRLNRLVVADALLVAVVTDVAPGDYRPTQGAKVDNLGLRDYWRLRHHCHR